MPALELETGSQKDELRDYAGLVEQIDTSILKTLLDSHFIPVIAPIGVDEKGQSYNINADTVAGKVASVLNAEKLILLTDKEGLLDKDGHLLTGLNSNRVSELIADGTIKDGMLPKVACAIDAIASGVASCHIINGSLPHAVLLEVFTAQGVGTLITTRAV